VLRWYHTAHKEMPMGPTEKKSTRDRMVRVRFPAPLGHAMDLARRKLGTTESGTVRGLVEAGLREMGLWPPAARGE
jgi:hypothetical protein